MLFLSIRQKEILTIGIVIVFLMGPFALFRQGALIRIRLFDGLLESNELFIYGTLVWGILGLALLSYIWVFCKGPDHGIEYD